MDDAIEGNPPVELNCDNKELSLESSKDSTESESIQEENQDREKEIVISHQSDEETDAEAQQNDANDNDEVYVCFCCMQEFDSLEELEIHEQDHSDENPYRCSFCPRLFSCYDRRGEHERACRETKITKAKTEKKQMQVVNELPIRSRRGRPIKVKIDYNETSDSDNVDIDETGDLVSDESVLKLPKKKPVTTRVKAKFPGKSKGQKVKVVRKVEQVGKGGGCHVCPLCSASFGRISHLNRHLTGKHSVTWIPCKVCKKMCETKEELDEHEQSHACGICGKIIKFDANMIQHKLMHIREQQRKNKEPALADPEKLQCGVCGMNFKYIRSAREHEKRHSDPPIFRCVQCPRKFSTEEKRLRHQEKCKPNPHQCKDCDKTFKYRYQREMHVIEVHTGNYYECQMCGQKFSNKGTWRTHEKLHTKEKEFKCPICGKMFHYQASLNDHQTQVHSNEKPFQCMFCGIGVKSKGALKKHEALHTGAIMFKCEHCDAQFNSRMKLSTHVQEKHTGRMFICKSCGKGFTNARYLRNHEVIHTGEKPYKCPHCGMGFRRQHHVTQHVPRHFKQPGKLLVNLDNNNVAFQSL